MIEDHESNTAMHIIVLLIQLAKWVGQQAWIGNGGPAQYIIKWVSQGEVRWLFLAGVFFQMWWCKPIFPEEAESGGVLQKNHEELPQPTAGIGRALAVASCR